MAEALVDRLGILRQFTIRLTGAVKKLPAQDFDSLRDDPRFDEYIRHVGFPEK